MKKNIIIGVVVLVVVALAVVFLLRKSNKSANTTDSASQSQSVSSSFSGEASKIENNAIFIKGMYLASTAEEAKNGPIDVQAKLAVGAKITKNSFEVPGKDIKPGQAFDASPKSETVNINQMVKDLAANTRLVVEVKSGASITGKTQFEVSEVSYEFPITK